MTDETTSLELGERVLTCLVTEDWHRGIPQEMADAIRVRLLLVNRWIPEGVA